jgi:hypothetical protein
MKESPYGMGKDVEALPNDIRRRGDNSGHGKRGASEII